MAYTVISVFPATADTEEIKSELKNQGFSEEDIIVSKSKFENESIDDDYQTDERTAGFWNHIFANENEMLDAYSRESVGKINVVVYAPNIDAAQCAKAALNDKGAIEVQRRQAEDQQNTQASTSGLSEDAYNGIIAKAKHNLYFLGSERTYSSPTKGMNDEMDSLGSKD
ncbi:hypothetical protein [Chryseobacterium chendengshani]|uniref:hypothetical protein n=1 Tax=Chryseobacterium sp. LJ756 TaxID=2864113 RepID=UPI001C63C99A|nr:hypothetical protein [Chryseobacterium sp. LJ756]MBW7675153.1 hypothetical protein [Chryseobacterium sp. LJ756]